MVATRDITDIHLRAFVVNLYTIFLLLSIYGVVLSRVLPMGVDFMEAITRHTYLDWPLLSGDVEINPGPKSDENVEKKAWTL